MPNTRENLVELIASKVCDTYSEAFEEWLPHDCGKCYANNCHIAEIADYLIANGVTVQKWIPVTARLPNKEEYTAKTEDGTEYYVRLLIAYKTDIVEYEIGYYDGYKWLSEMPMRRIRDVVAWMPFPEAPKE